VVLAGGYQSDKSRIAVVELKGRDAEPLGCFHMDGIGVANLLQGRADTIHAVSDGQWLRLTVSDVRGRLGV